MSEKNREEKKIITVKDLIKQKEALRKRKDEQFTLYVKSLDANITVKKADRLLVAETLDMDENEDTDAYLVYNCVVEPNLKDEELRKEFNIKYPPSIVEEIFEAGEINQISKQIMKLSGYNDSVNIVDDIKN